MDLSSNKLDGEIPKSLTNLQQLKFFNVSFNQLVGFVPNLGPFANLTDKSFLGNPHLCGPNMPNQCSMSCNGIRCHWLQIILPLVAISIVVALALAALWFWFIPKASHLGLSNTSIFQNFSQGKFSEVVVLQTMDDQGEDSNVIARGANSIIYKGILPGGKVFALKKLLSNNINKHNTDLSSEVVVKGVEDGKTDDLLREAEILAKLRHKNILKVLGFYSSLDHKVLILE